MKRETRSLAALAMCLVFCVPTAGQGKIPFQVGIETTLRKIRRDKPYRGPIANQASVELAQNEYEGFQVVIAGVKQDIKGLSLTPGDLKAERGGGVIGARHITVNPVGYVITAKPKYKVEWVGLWPDPLLNVEKVDVPARKVQPFWVTVYAPRGTQAGKYKGTLTLKADGTAARTVSLSVRVFDFELPTRPSFDTMSVGGRLKAKNWGLDRESPEFEKLKVRYYSLMLRNRLGPGGFILNAWSWAKPAYPVKVNADGTYDFSEVERWGKFCFDRGMTTFVAVSFAKPGKWGFPKTYPAWYRAGFKKFVPAYVAFLRKKGWLKDAVAYNIDEAWSKKEWEMCRENYRQVKSIAKDFTVFQCLNNPKGVAALDGFYDIMDVNISQFHQGATPQFIAKGGIGWWCVCIWPDPHPNLFLDYPAMDARIIGWLSWKNKLSGFEYWSTNSYERYLPSIAPKTFIDTVESGWIAGRPKRSNGEGYLVYPGPNRSVLSSVRFEILRDGFEDYEYLAILKRRLEGKSGRTASEARKLLKINDNICKTDLTYTNAPKVIFDARRKIAEAIEKLPE